MVVVLCNMYLCPYDSSCRRYVQLRAFSTASRIEHAALQLHVVFCISTLYFVEPTKADLGAAYQANLGMSRLPCSHSAFGCHDIKYPKQRRSSRHAETPFPSHVSEMPALCSVIPTVLGWQA